MEGRREAAFLILKDRDRRQKAPIETSTNSIGMVNKPPLPAVVTSAQKFATPTRPPPLRQFVALAKFFCR
jgi:hypothetical protein